MKRTVYSLQFTVYSLLVALFVFFAFPSEINSAEEGVQVAQAAVVETAISAPPSLPRGMRERVSLDLRNIEIIEALKFLALKARINIVATSNVSGRTTLMVENVQVKDIFDIMLRSNGLAYSKEREIYNVMTEEEYKNIFGKNFADIREVKTFRLKYAIPEQAFNLIDTLKSTIGRVLVESDSGTVLIMDTPEKIREIEKALSTLEQRNLVQVFNLKYARAKDIEAELKLQLDTKGVGTVKADERSNQLIVQTLPRRMQEIEGLVTALDEKTQQVLIDAKIIKIKLSDQTDTGIDWEGIGGRGERIGMLYFGSSPFSVIESAASTADWLSRQQFFEQTMGGEIGAYRSSGYSTTYTGGQKVAPGEAMHIGILNPEADFDLLIRFLQTLGSTQILSNPRLSVINNQEARIHVGERQAYVTTTTTTGQATSTVSEDVTFLDVGIQLSVTPTINDEGYITMKVKPEVSSVISTLITPSGNKIPIVDTSTAETTVLVKDGATIIIGGLRKEEKTVSSKGIPFLSKIPIFGNLFKSATDTIERTELLVLITPRVVSGDVLTTGDERDFGYKPPKEYKEYMPFTQETDFIPPTEAAERKVLSY